MSDGTCDGAGELTRRADGERAVDGSAELRIRVLPRFRRVTCEVAVASAS